jgi:hypothetical protein
VVHISNPSYSEGRIGGSMFEANLDKKVERPYLKNWWYTPVISVI